MHVLSIYFHYLDDSVTVTSKEIISSFLVLFVYLKYNLINISNKHFLKIFKQHIMKFYSNILNALTVFWCLVIVGVVKINIK
jgi:hypothetical protein